MATIVTKNSSTASAVPTTSDLVQGELAVNVTDKRIFTENASTQIVELGTNPSTITTATATVTGTLTANGTFASNNAVITGGSINSTPIGATTPSTVRGSTVTATTGFVGGLTGNVTGNLTGNVTGNVVGNLTGNVTGNVTASTGTTTLNNLVVNGTADFTNTKLTNITTPTLDSDAANKGYVDATVAAVIDSAPAALDTLNELAAALGDDANFSATVTTALATKLPLAGGTMTGAIAMGTSKITGLGDPTASQDAATKTYVDTADATKLNLSGGTMSGAIAMGTNKITGLGDPTLAQDAATKAYTDSILGSATSAAASAAAAATSESNAATSASNAATSETNALNSANAAASSYDQFDDRYLGDKASDPTLDNDGNALLTGALYFNTTTDVMRVYTGSAWQDVAISTNSPTFTGTVTADGLSLGDNEKATFGNSNDLEIYHDGSSSFISDQGTGNLRLLAQNFVLADPTNTEAMIVAFPNSSVDIYYDNSKKLETTATGIDVTGTVVSDAIQVDTDSGIVLKDGADSRTLTFKIDAGTGRYQASGSADHYFTTTDSNLSRFYIANNGDISFYEDTGTTPKFFWDASAESLGIGTTDIDGQLTLEGTTTSSGDANFNLAVNDTTSVAQGVGGGILFRGMWGGSNPTGGGFIQTEKSNATSGNFAFDLVLGSRANGDVPTERLRIDSSGNVGIGTSSPSTALSGTATVLEIANVNVASVKLSNTGAGAKWELASVNDGSFRIYDDDAEKLRIDSSGNVGIGTSSPAYTLDVDGDVRFYDSSSSSANYYFEADHYCQINITGDKDASAGGPYNTAITANGSNGDLELKTNNLRRVVIDQSGNVGIGTTSPSSFYAGAQNLVVGSGSGESGMTIYSSATNYGNIYFADGTSGSAPYAGYIEYNHTNNFFRFGANAAERMRIDSSGNLLVGTTNPDVSFGATTGSSLQSSGQTHHSSSGTSLILNRTASDGNLVDFRKGGTTVGSIGTSGGALQVSGNTNSGLQFNSSAFVPMQNGATIDAAIDLGSSARRFKDLYLSGGVLADTLTFKNLAGTERMRIDSSGNLLVGKTSVDNTTAGHRLDSSGFMSHVRDGNAVALYNRLTSDGSIVEFRKDGTTVGSIGISGSNIYIAGSSTYPTGIRFYNAGMNPCDNTGAYVDNAKDVGASNVRWDDIYATNGTIQTSDRNEKQDIDSLSDAETRVAVACKGLLRKFRWKSAVEENGDDARIHFGIIAQDLQAAFTAEGLDAGRYAMFIHSTWTDEETGEERSRMGVRYSELLAFIIAAL